MFGLRSHRKQPLDVSLSCWQREAGITHQARSGVGLKRFHGHSPNCKREVLPMLFKIEHCRKRESRSHTRMVPGGCQFTIAPWAVRGPGSGAGFGRATKGSIAQGQGSDSRSHHGVLRRGYIINLPVRTGSAVTKIGSGLLLQNAGSALGVRPKSFRITEQVLF